MRYKLKSISFLALIMVFFGMSRIAYADEGGPSGADLQVMMDTIWTMITAFLVFWMNAGFALVEAGFCRSKNAANILAKNFIVFACASLAFWAIGFGLMFGDGLSVIGLKGFFILGQDNSPAKGDAYAGVFSSLNWTGVPLYAKFFFQLVFAGTAATIVSGAVAERIKFGAFIIFSFVMVGLIYAIGGHWIWGGGFLAKLGMYDFAGSTVVHSIGGWAALAGIIVLGPRLGKYKKDGSVRAIPGHSMALATLGALILWLGWFGFNPGSTMAADGAAIARIALTTNLAAAAAMLSATLVAWAVIGKPDLSMMVNGTLAGLVAITASCAFVGPASSVIIGLISGVLVVYAVLFFDKMKLDDPVGATSVHLVNGVFGTLCVGLFAQNKFGGIGDGLFFGGGAKLLFAQAVGVVCIAVFTFVSAYATWRIIKAVFGMRVSVEEEMNGLDLGEMGMEAYPDDPIAGFDPDVLVADMKSVSKISLERGNGGGLK